MKRLAESSAAAVATTALARDVGDGQRLVAQHYVPTGAAVAHGAQLQDVNPNARDSDVRRAGGRAHEPLARLEGLDSYLGGGYETGAGAIPPRG
jgi:hypothetical protein